MTFKRKGGNQRLREDFRAEPQIWLKALGTAASPLGRDWLDQRGELLKRVNFSRRTPSLREGDVILYYAAGWQRIFAAGVLTSDPALLKEPANPRWPWQAKVHLHLLVPDLTRAPDLKRAGIDTYSVRSKSHIRLNETQYRQAVAGLAEAASLDSEPYAALRDNRQSTS